MQCKNSFAFIILVNNKLFFRFTKTGSCKKHAARLYRQGAQVGSNILDIFEHFLIKIFLRFTTGKAGYCHQNTFSTLLVTRSSC